jgi:NADPH2:quinone reductase
MHAIRVSRTGDPSVLEYVSVDRPRPGKGEALVRIEAIGVNYIDVYHRTGLYKLPLPFTPGQEAAGVVEEVGPEVEGLKGGDRVGYTMTPGSYAEHAVVPAWKLVPLPPALETRLAAALLLQGMTAHYLVTSVYPLKPGDRVLVHAAAGGVGGLLVQMAKQRGARVFGTASTPKLDLVRDLGADHVIDYTAAPEFDAEVLRLTGGAGVNVVYDSVGRTTFDRSLEALSVRGYLALFGQSSGPVPPLEPSRLAVKGNFLTRPSLAHYAQTREELLWRAREVFEAAQSGALRVRIDREIPLREAAEAHRLLESRKTTGKLLLVP